MSWVKIDDGMPDHRKWASLEANPREWAECMAVWVAVACYAARTLSDGYAETARIERLTPLGKLAIKRCDAMVEASLMVKEDSGYRIHDWTDYNPAAQATRALRQAEAKRKAEKRGSKKQGTYDECPPRTDSGQDAGQSPDGGPDKARTSGRSPPRSPGTPRARVSRPDPTPSPDPLRGSDERSPALPGSEPELLEDQSPHDETTPDSWPTDTDSETDEPSLETQLRRGYQRRYQRETGEAWMVHARAHEPVQRVAAWARLQADPEAAIERFLDGAFADPVRASGTTDTRWRDERWPWSWLAQDPNLTCSRTKLAQRPAVNARGSSDASPAAKPPHGRPALTETEACAYERQRERARGTRTTPATKAAELTALEGAKAKGWDADADERSGWTP